MSVVHGRLQRAAATNSAASTHGAPRRQGRLQSLQHPGMLLDADAGELAAWLSSPTAELPRGWRREPRAKGGSVAFLRDVSDSMWGGRAYLASAVSKAAINLAKRRHMRFGYAEFASSPNLYLQGADQSSSQFFGRDYEACREFASRLATDGYTNLQDVLAEVLPHFRQPGLPPSERHVVLITDGAPTTG